MITNRGQRPQHLFVVRIWQEPDAVASNPQWRGLVKHSSSEQNHYFTCLQDLLAFIAQLTKQEVCAGVGQQEQ